MRTRGEGADSPLGNQPFINQKVPLWFFLNLCFRSTNPKVFAKASSAPMKTIDEARAEKKTHFFGQNCPKRAQKQVFCHVFLVEIKAILIAQASDKEVSELTKIPIKFLFNVTLHCS